jgi:hypothetical protein
MSLPDLSLSLPDTSSPVFRLTACCVFRYMTCISYIIHRTLGFQQPTTPIDRQPTADYWLILRFRCAFEIWVFSCSALKRKEYANSRIHSISHGRRLFHVISTNKLSSTFKLMIVWNDIQMRRNENESIQHEQLNNFRSTGLILYRIC